jgi:putative aldouronate transport system substrate-binding protein
MSGAFGVGCKFYLSDNMTKVNYGPYEPAFKDYLQTMNQWYKEGLLDPDFATNDKKAMDSKVMGDKAGAMFGYHSWISNYQTQVRPKNPKFTLVGAPYPVKNKGDIPSFGFRASEYIPSASAYITPANKYNKETAMLLDYGYSEEGNLLYNFGVEGESYTMVNNYPKYTDKVLNDPKGIAALNKYINVGPFITDPRYFEQTLVSKEQTEGIKVAAQAKSFETTMPPITIPEADAQRVASISNEVTTYTNEMMLKFIIGQEPLSNYSKFIEQLKKLGLEEEIKIRQKALDAYNKR